MGCVDGRRRTSRRGSSYFFSISRQNQASKCMGDKKKIIMNIMGIPDTTIMRKRVAGDG